MSSTLTLRRPLVLASVMAATFMIAIEATIVSTAMPQIAGELGDLHLYSWAFSAFLLTQTATTVMFGKLADLYGRRPVLLGGIALFLVGSVLCGMAWSMPSLILFRLVQGAGAGAIQPICLTIVGDLYTVQERGKIQGWLASVWGVSSVAGPLAGGLITQHLSWVWIFWINLPIGVLATFGFIAFLHEKVGQRRHSLDLTGAGLFTLGITSLMVGLTLTGTGSGAATPVAFGLALIGAILFVLQERRAAEPMIDIRLWARRPIATANAATLFSGMAVIGLTTFLPMYVQGVLGQTALVAGFALTMMVLGWPVGATVAARNFHRFGLRGTLILGGALLPAGATAFLLLRPGLSPAVAGGGSLVMGLGMGFLSTAAIVLIQSSVGWAERGAATASNIFSRNLGSTLGAAVLGAVMNWGLREQDGGTLPLAMGEGAGGMDSILSDPALRAALDGALHLTFWGVFTIAVLTLLAALLVPRVAIGQPAQEARPKPG
ncbi:MDR family MFS transporter [Pseudoroseomonas globiformis]|uniref:MDR family MFS transporter n=1 Tax=Teichococcus globiformis TaxID=2307229 RepID=A0ABV7FYV5_9PROT